MMPTPPVLYNATNPPPYYDDPAQNYTTPVPTFPDTWLTNRDVQYNEGVGGLTLKTYQSPTKTNIQAIEAYYINNFSCTTRIVEGGPFYVLTVHLPWDEFQIPDGTPGDSWASEQSINIWEIDGGKITKSILNVPIYNNNAEGLTGNGFNGGYVDLPATVKATIQNAINNNDTTYPIMPDLSAYSTPQQQVIAQNAQLCFQLMRNGVTSREIDCTILRLTSTYPVGFTAAGSDPYSMQNFTSQFFSPLTNTITPVVLSDTYLISTWNIPDYIVSSLPSSYIRTISSVSDAFTMTVWGAYKMDGIPKFKYLTPNKCQLSIDFIFNEWETDLYTPLDNDPDSNFPQLNL